MPVKKDDNSPRGNAARAAIATQQRESRRRNRGTGQQADWQNANAELLLKLICNIAAYGAAVQFGYTRDGGSLVVRIVGDGEPFNEYVRPTEDLDEYLRALAMDYEK